jgi:hypothetical protein
MLLMAAALGAQPDVDQVAGRVVQLANGARQAEKRPPVAPDPRLAATARYFARYMAEADQLGHEADGATPADRARRHGYDHCLVLENIAFEFHSAGFSIEGLAGQFVQGWLRSPGHRANLLDADATETGVAVARSAKTGRYYAVQMLARPKSQSIRFEIANRSGAAAHYRIGERRFTLAPLQIRTHEECRPGELVLAAAGETVTITPANGGRFVISRSGISRD